MIDISIAGASGYTGLELIRLLLKHPEVRFSTLTSETYAGKSIAEVFPSLEGHIDHKLVPLSENIGNTCHILFLALPHTTGMKWMPQFLASPCKVIDLSADFRIKSAEIFEQWYHTPHLQPDLLPKAEYGLPEFHRNAIQSARLVANPGCYPTSVILGLAPLIIEGLVNLDSLIADSKSGVSGAGRKASLSTQYSECNEGVSPYGLGNHRHTPEIEQELTRLANRDLNISFSPHLIPMTRGMESTLYAKLKKEISTSALQEIYQRFYQGEPFVRILKPGSFARTGNVVYSNYCDIGVTVDSRTGRAIITSALDNLIKGASGQAVQNMNIMQGFGERTGLDFPAIFP